MVWLGWARCRAAFSSGKIPRRKGNARSLVAQVLTKDWLKEAGKPAIYVKQNSRPQLLYTDEDMLQIEGIT